MASYAILLLLHALTDVRYTAAEEGPRMATYSIFNRSYFYCLHVRITMNQMSYTGLILGLRSANESRRYFVTTSLIGWAQT